LPDDAGLGQALIVAAVRADNLRLEGQGARARFRVAGARIALTEWLLDGELARLEKELFAVANRYREACRRSLLKQLQELPPRALGELVVLLMEKNGLSELAPVRRPGAPGPELHLSGKVSSAAGTLRGALVVRRDGREIGRERVTELRGTLHHYGPAQVGWIITTGQVLSGAREESAAAAASPVNLIDGLGLARLCEEHHVGVVETRITLPLPDIDLLEALRSS
jgi:restriction endonuclease Mrr